MDVSQVGKLTFKKQNGSPFNFFLSASLCTWTQTASKDPNHLTDALQLKLIHCFHGLNTSNYSEFRGWLHLRHKHFLLYS